MTYGCYNRPPLKSAIVAHGIDSQNGGRIRVIIPHAMTTECQYQKHDAYNDPGCQGCSHKQPKETQDWSAA